MLMGYSETQKGYILLNLHTHQFFVNRDVIFKENEFPFANASITVQAKVHDTPAPMEHHNLFDDCFAGEEHSNSNVDQGYDVVAHDYAIEDDIDGQSGSSAEQVPLPTDEEQLLTDTSAASSLEELLVEEGVMTHD